MRICGYFVFDHSVTKGTMMISYDTPAYLVQLSDGWRFVYVLASMSEQHDGKGKLYVEISKIRFWSWNRTTQ